MKTYVLTVCLLTIASGVQASSQIDLPGPPGSGEFGSSVTVLPNGNFVVTDPDYDLPSPPTSNVGAAYLYTPEGSLISMLHGTHASDSVGNDGVVVLTNGNFVVKSDRWNGYFGALTWGHAETGFMGGAVTQVGAGNSFVGGSASDFLVAEVRPLPNGHYVLVLPRWDNFSPTATNAGAVAWGNGFAGSAGLISSSNALVGTHLDDWVGVIGSFLVILPNGHYVVNSPNWDDGPIADVGATTWCNGFTGTSGEVSASNSLIGGQAGDGGSVSVTVLPNGSYTVGRGSWDLPSPPTPDVGAVTWCRSDGPTTGVVSTTNSAHGSSAGDSVSFARALADGRYLIVSSGWDDPVSGLANAGIITLANAATGLTGPLQRDQSLVGSSAGDFANFGVLQLSNGNQVIYLAQWDHPSGLAADVGLVLFIKAGAKLTGTTTPAMGLTGETASDRVGENVVALSNGNYVVRSRLWDNVAAGIADAGAVTWCNGRTGRTGKVSPSNSLVGPSASDGALGSVVSLPLNPTGNYVVVSPSWDDPAAGLTDVGAVTWVDGSRGITGVVSSSNSLTGTSASDGTSMAAVALENGNYVVRMQKWDDTQEGMIDTGAVIWCDGTRGRRGKVLRRDALVGTTTGDEVGTQVFALRGGNYLVTSHLWDHAALGLSDIGALTWGDGSRGTTGEVSPINSVIGTSPGDSLGSIGSVGFELNHPEKTIAYTRLWDNPAGPLVEAGVYVVIDNQVGETGLVSQENSVLGIMAGGPSIGVSDYDPLHDQLIVGRRASNMVTLFRPSSKRSLARSSAEAPGAVDIAFAKPGFAALNSAGEVLADWTLLGSGSAAGKNRALFDSDDLVLQTGTPLSILGGGLPPSAKATALFGQTFQQAGRGLFQATVSGTGISTANNRLLLLDNGAGIMMVKRTGQAWGVAPQTAAQFSAFDEVLQSYDQDLIALTYKLKANAAISVDSGNDSGLLLMNHSGAITNSLPREGEASFGGGGAFGQFSALTTAAQGEFIHFIAAHDPSGNSPPVPAIFRMKKDGTSTSRPAQVGAPVPGIAGASFRSFTGLSQNGGQGIVLANFAGTPTATNQALYSVPGNVVVARKGAQVDPTNAPALVIAKILRFWSAGFNQVILQVQLSGGTTSANNQALLLRQGTSYLILARTGSALPGGILKTLNAVEVHPVSGKYALLGTLAGAPSSANQALWIGDSQTGNDTTLSPLRLPALKLRKGQIYRTGSGLGSTVRGIAIKPAPDPSGAGGRGLAQIMSLSGDIAVTLTTNLNLQELVLIER